MQRHDGVFQAILKRLPPVVSLDRPPAFLVAIAAMRRWMILGENTPPFRPRKNCDGFTLIEILVVLVILGLMTGLVLNRGTPVRTSLQMRAAMTQVAQYLRTTRARAIAANLPITVAFDPTGHFYGVEGGDRRALPVPLKFSFFPQAPILQSATIQSATIQNEPVARDSRFGITLTPDGGSSGGQILFDQ